MVTGGSLKVTCSNKQDLNLKVSNNLKITIQSGKNELTEIGDVLTNVTNGEVSNTSRVAQDQNGNIFTKTNQTSLALREKSYSIMQALVALDGDAGTLSIQDAQQAHILKGKHGVKDVSFSSQSSTLTIVREDGVKIRLDFESERERAKTNPTPEEAKKTEHYTNELRGKYYTDDLVFQKPRYKVDTYVNGTLYVELLNDIESKDILKDFGCQDETLSKEKFKKGDIIGISNIDQKKIRDNRTLLDKAIDGFLDYINDNKTTYGTI